MKDLRDLKHFDDTRCKTYKRRPHTDGTSDLFTAGADRLTFQWESVPSTAKAASLARAVTPLPCEDRIGTAPPLARTDSSVSMNDFRSR